MFYKIKSVLDRSLEFLVGLSMLVLVLDVLWGVFRRYILGHQSKWTDELATYLMIWVGLLGASVALNRRAHLGIDYFVGKMSIRTRLYTELFVFAVIALFSFLVLVYGGTVLTTRVLALNQITPALHLKMGYVYMALPISGVFLVLYSIEFFFQTLVNIARHKNEVAGHSDSSIKTT